MSDVGPEWVPLKSWIDPATGDRMALIRWRDGREEVRRVSVSVDVKLVDAAGAEHAVEVSNVRVGACA